MAQVRVRRFTNGVRGSARERTASLRGELSRLVVFKQNLEDS